MKMRMPAGVQCSRRWRKAKAPWTSRPQPREVTHSYAGGTRTQTQPLLDSGGPKVGAEADGKKGEKDSGEMGRIIGDAAHLSLNRQPPRQKAHRDLWLERCDPELIMCGRQRLLPFDDGWVIG